MLLTANPQTLALKAKLFRGFSDPARLAILTALRSGSRTVSEIVTAASLSQPNTSNHLACLHDCGLVSREQDGRYVRYALSDPRVADLLNLADELLADVAKGVYECTRYQASEV